MNKLLVTDPSGTAMIRRSAEAALASRCFATIVVLGHQERDVAAVLDSLPDEGSRLQRVRVTDPSAGIAASLAAGLGAAVALQAEAAAICLGDMPHVRPATIDRLIAALTRAPSALGCVPCWQGARGNPVLWHNRAFAQLADLRGDRGGGQLMDRLGGAMLRLEVDDPGIMEDFDTPERLARFAAGAGPSPS